MKVNIGPYLNYWGPYQIAEKLIFWDKDTAHKVGKYLHETPLVKFTSWVYSKRARKQKVTIHKYDVWSMDNTLALIILPMLKMLKVSKQGAPYVDSSDTPWYLSRKFFTLENDYDADPSFFKRWDWVLDEMIWTFEQLNDNWELKDFISDKDGYTKHNDRITNGLRLFGKYYRSLWD